jgi:hypothetical protein
MGIVRCVVGTKINQICGNLVDFMVKSFFEAKICGKSEKM